MADRWEDGPAQRLDRLLRAAGVRNVDAARSLELDQSTISKYRSGERIPSVDDFARMIEMAKGSADEVLGLRPAAVEPGLLRALVEAAGVVVEAAPQLRGPRGKR